VSREIDDIQAELLAAVVRGELARDHPEVVELLRRRPELARELDQLGEVAAALHADGRSVRAEIEAARADASCADRTRVAAALARRSRSSGRRRWMWPALIAAAVVVAFGIQRWFAQPDEHRPILLDGAQVFCIEPAGEVSEFGVFRWRAQVPPGGWCEVTVHALGSDGSRGSKLVDARVRGLDWSPSDAEQAAFGDAIEWTVQVREPNGSVVGSASARARRALR